MVPTARLAMASLVGLVALGAFVGACSYAWPLGAPVDGGDAPGPSDASIDGEAANDAQREGDGTSLVDSPSEGGAPDCAALAAELAARKSAARRCPVPYTYDARDCTTDVADECGCRQWMYRAGSQAAQDYASALAAFEKASCAPSCGACSVPSDAAAGLCIVGADGGSVFCQP